MTRGGPRHQLAIVVCSLLAAFSLAATVSAQDAAPVNEDDLFGSGDMVETITESSQGSAVKDLLTTDTVRVGGSLTGTVTTTWQWNDPWSNGLTLSDSYGLTPELSALLFFDGRPSESTRFYGSVKSAWPFMAKTAVLDSSGTKTGDTVDVPNLQVFELFSDFSWNDSLYMRFGKQTINWGVGYFYSPANIMNLQQIDPTDPTAQLEGPVALRAMVPIKGTQHNIWGYAVFDSATMKPEDTALAAKAELVFGGWELGLGGYYKKDDPIRGMVTAVGSIRDISLFGEATVSRGSSRTWVTEVTTDPLTNFITTTTDDTSLFFKGTAGFRYSNSTDNWSLLAQYLYDGEGYSNTDREARIEEAYNNEDAIKATLGPNADTLFSTFLKGLILNSGRHYAALSFSKSKFLTDDLTVSLFAMGNLSDFSVYIKPSLSYAFFDGLSMSLSPFFAFGFDSGEYVVLNDGRAVGITVVMTLGSGSF
ncbi:MAG TPA: hypothetical protein VMX33_12545 [bacterium]|nr:hypothetical protein [bacterium]